MASPKVFYFESKHNHLFLELPSGKNVEFVGNTFVTDDESLANQIRSSGMYGKQVQEVEGVIAQPKKKYVIHSGARPASVNE
jgi:hypothetical protein